MGHLWLRRRGVLSGRSPLQKGAGHLWAVLEGLKLSDADYERGLDIAIEALRAASTHGWEPL
jgi:hypothetical protein